MNTAAAEWFVVQTNPQREDFVAEYLEEFKPYLPRIKTPKGRIAALFPSYLFFPAMEFWSPLKNAVGVRSVLMSGARPARIGDAIIRSWRNREQNGIVKLPPPPKFHKGERLVITRGTLRHRIVLYDSMHGKDRERVLIEMLNAWVPLTIPTADLAPEGPPRFRHGLRDSHKAL